MSIKEFNTTEDKKSSESLTVKLPGLRRKGSMRPNRSIIRGRSLRPVIIHPHPQTLIDTEELTTEKNND